MENKWIYGTMPEETNYVNIHTIDNGKMKITDRVIGLSCTTMLYNGQKHIYSIDPIRRACRMVESEDTPLDPFAIDVDLLLPLNEWAWYEIFSSCVAWIPIPEPDDPAWIKCSDRLPEDGAMEQTLPDQPNKSFFLAMAQNEETMIVSRVYKDGDWKWDIYEGSTMLTSHLEEKDPDIVIRAWIPIPAVQED